jgi:Family of unknown function (DUF6533)
MAETQNVNLILLDSIKAEVFGVVVTRYVSAAALIILFYDCIITLEDEVSEVKTLWSARSLRLLLKVRLIWPGAVTFPKLLYFTNRYLTIILVLTATYCQSSFSHEIVEQLMSLQIRPGSDRHSQSLCVIFHLVAVVFPHLNTTSRLFFSFSCGCALRTVQLSSIGYTREFDLHGHDDSWNR